MKDKIRRFNEFVEDSRFLHESYFIILSVVLAFGLLQTSGAALGTDKPVVTVISTSMCPALQVGDILFVQGQEYENIERDDIIVYDVPHIAEITVNGEDYRLEGLRGPSQSVDTDIGTVRLEEVRPSGMDSSRDSAIFSINGTVVQSNGQDSALLEGNSYDFPGGTLSINSLIGPPHGDVPIVHRVIEKNEDYLQTIGDNNDGQLEFEKRITPEQIQGDVAFRIPYAGLLKIGLMDITGYTGEPFTFDSTPSCGRA